MKNVQPRNGLKGFQFNVKPGANGFGGFAKPPSYAFNGPRSHMMGSGFGGFGGQLGRMPQPNLLGRMGGTKRFASTNAQMVNKNVQMLGFENFPTQMVRDQIARAVELAAGQPTRQKIAQGIRESFWHMFKFPNNDVHVLISEAEMQIARVAKEGVARFKIQKNGQDLFVTLIRRSGTSPAWKTPLNYGGTMGDRALLQKFSREGLDRLQNIFRPQSVEYILKSVREVFKSGGSDSAMAQQVESLLQKKWGQGWNVVVSATETTINVNAQDVMARFWMGGKVRRFFTVIRGCP